MKKFFLWIILFLFLTTNVSYSKESDEGMPVIKFNGAKFSLYYSAKNQQTGGYLNEYYKKNETYGSWKDLIGVHHYPTAFYPIEHAKSFCDYLNDSGVPAYVEVNDKENSAILYFTVTSNRQIPNIIEFNVFKYEKSPVCGTVAIQFVKRYLLNNPLEMEKTKKLFIKSGIKYIKKVEKFEIPNIITSDVEQGIYLKKEIKNEESLSEKSSENKVSEQETPSDTNEMTKPVNDENQVGGEGKSPEKSVNSENTDSENADSENTDSETPQ